MAVRDARVRLPAVLVIIGPIEVLVPFAVRDQTGTGPAGYAFVLASYGVGAVIGSIFASAGRLPRRYLTWMLLLWGAGSAPVIGPSAST